MNNNILCLLWCCSFVAATDCFSQESVTARTVFPAGISARAAVGYLATRDEHISDEKYAGRVSGFALLWSRFHETYGFHMGLTYEKASDITNHNVSAGVTQGAFIFEDLYPLGTGDLSGTEFFLYLGPSAEAFLYYRKQMIAQNTDASPDVYESGAWLFSLGAALEMILPLGGGFQAEGSLQTGLLSLGGGTGNDSGSPTALTLLTPFSGLHGAAGIGVRYYPLECLSLAAGYRLEVTRIDSWNFILTSSDNAFVSLGFHF